MLSLQESGSALELRPHQRECVDAIVEALENSPDGDVRAQVVMATGTGKTLTAAIAARRLVPHGRVLVLVPTLDLLAQTLHAWRRAGHRGRMIAVCSGLDDNADGTGDVACTTDPAELAARTAADGPLVVVATYASLVDQTTQETREARTEARAGVLERALQAAGLTLDLIVLDEAHRTSGDLGKSWAACLNQTRMPAARRLAMTATPRLWEMPDGGGEVRQVASMDDTALYGERVFELELMEAVERGLLARWEIDVLEVTDPHAGEGQERGEQEQGQRLAALQAALLVQWDERAVRNLLTFHSTTLAAMSFARALPATAAELYARDPARYPRLVAAEWLSGEHATQHRREVLGRFADGLLGADGFVQDFQVLASCQVLAEGVDIRGRLGVDGVVFADARSSPVQVVQILGRALRQEPGEGKIARIIVPVFLAPGEEPDAMMASPAYRPLVQILQGLQAHDERIIQRLAAASAHAAGTPTGVVQLDPHHAPHERQGEAEDEGRDEGGDEGRETSEDADQKPAADGQDADAEEDAAGDGSAPSAAQGQAEGAGVPLLRFSRPRDAAAIARFLRTRVLQPDSEVWLHGYELLRRWVEHYGHAEVPVDAVVDEDGIDVTDQARPAEPLHRLGAWVSEQRTALAQGRLRSHRFDLLEEVGMVWRVRDARFQRGLIAARECMRLYGTLAVRNDTVLDDFPVGEWLKELRKAANAGRLAGERDAALVEIDPYWNPPWPRPWQRAWAGLALLLGEEPEPSLALVPPGVMVHGVDVGVWARRQLAAWDQLADGQRGLLTRLGITPTPDETGDAPTVVVGLADLDAFGRGMAAARQYLAREGHLTVPRGHVEVLVPAEDGQQVEHKLGAWLNNQKARRSKHTAQRRAQLADLGLEWAT